jgi:diacylglycerol kinase (ATP)
VTLTGIERVVAVSNPESGGGRFRRDVPLMLDLLRSFGLQVEECRSTGPGHAMDLARRAVAEGAQLVCAIGGDGTVNEVINGIAESDVPLLIVPAGTVNVLAQELGVPLEPADACRLAGSGNLSWIDLGRAGDRYFALMAGVGMDAAVVQSMNPVLKKMLREAAFAVQGAATVLRGDFPRIRVVTEEQTVEGYFAVLGNSSNYGGAFGITPMASMRDGLLDVCVLQNVSPLSTLQYWLAALVESHLKHPQVQYWRTKDAEISVVEGDGEVLVQTDGEMAGRLPMDVRIVPRALRVIVP